MSEEEKRETGHRHDEKGDEHAVEKSSGGNERHLHGGCCKRTTRTTLIEETSIETNSWFCGRNFYRDNLVLQWELL